MRVVCGMCVLFFVVCVVCDVCVVLFVLCVLSGDVDGVLYVWSVTWVFCWCASGMCFVLLWYVLCIKCFWVVCIVYCVWQSW